MGNLFSHYVSLKCKTSHICFEINWVLTSLTRMITIDDGNRLKGIGFQLNNFR